MCLWLKIGLKVEIDASGANHLIMISFAIYSAIYLVLFQGASGSADHSSVSNTKNYRHRIQKRESSCFLRLGCFSNAFPYNNSGGTLPEDPDFIQTTFYVFTRANPLIPKLVPAGYYTDLRLTNFMSNTTTKFIIHGFIQRGEVDWIKNMTRALLRRDNMNVIAVDWGRGSGFPYTQAAANTRVAGAEVAAFVQYMVENGNITTDLVHMIGHSLGAHVAGYAGERLTDLGRITGLDPAEPNFQDMDPAVRLDPTDAMFVDVIHTDGSSYSTVSGYGMSQAVGHMDFYPNGGVHQPGCAQVPWIVYFTGMHSMDLQDVKDTLGCSHSRAISLFTESINSPCPFTSYTCHDYTDFEDGRCLDCGALSCSVLGLDAPHSLARGKFYLKTQPRSPYCGYQYFVVITTGPAMRYASGDLSMQLVGPTGESAETDLHRERRTFLRSREYRAILLTTEDIRQLSTIRLHFQSHSFFTWSSSTITVSQVSITVGSTGQTIHFCPESLEISSDPVTLSTTSNDSGSCDP